MLLGRGLELVKDVVPDQLHVLPVLDDAVAHRVGELEQASVFVGLGAQEELLVVLVRQNFLMLWPPDTALVSLGQVLKVARL